MFPWPLTKQTGLGRAKIPRADKRALQAFQPAATGAEVATVLSPPAEQLPLKDRDATQVKKQKVLEIGPHPGALAADIPAGRTGLSAQCVHEGEYRHQPIPLLICKPHRCSQSVTIASYRSSQAGVGLLPEKRCVPGNFAKGIVHESMIINSGRIFKQRPGSFPTIHRNCHRL
jgi:hypothetical protein